MADEDLIVVGDKKYSQEELNRMVGLGEKYQGFQEKYDTDPDKAWSAYGKVTQENKDLRAKAEEAEELRKQIAILKNNPNNTNASGELTAEAKAQAKKAARDLDILTKDDIDDILKERGYVKKDDIDNAFTSRRIMSEFEELGKKYDGKDGRPKFDQDEMVAYMERTRITDPNIAYKTKYAEELATFNAEEIVRRKYPQLVTTKAGADDKNPKPTPVTKENLQQRLLEKLNPGIY